MWITRFDELLVREYTRVMDLDLEKPPKRTEQVLARFTVKELALIKQVMKQYRVKYLAEAVRVLAMAAVKEINP